MPSTFPEEREAEEGLAQEGEDVEQEQDVEEEVEREVDHQEVRDKQKSINYALGLMKEPFISATWSKLQLVITAD